MRLLETRLVRGVSRQPEVRALLGPPDGTGTALLPPDHRLQEVWYYEDIFLRDVSTGSERMRLDMRQQILLVLFDRGTFSGFLWSSNAIPGQL